MTAAPDVDPAVARLTLLRNLAQGRKWSLARAASRLSDDAAKAVAAAAGWPDRGEVRRVWLEAVREWEANCHPGLPALPAPAAEPDHPAVDTALALTRAVRAQDTTAIAVLTGDLTLADFLEVTVALAAMVPVGCPPDVALAWLDLPAEDWPEPVLAVEYARWALGARDVTAEAANVEHERRHPSQTTPAGPPAGAK